MVFNTGMVGYPESLTDPSYYGQILSLTYPLIGNYGIPTKRLEENLTTNFESHKIQVKGLVVNAYSEKFSHHAAAISLGEWMQEEKVPGITDIDVRALTKHLREKGAMLGKIIIQDEEIGFYNPNTANVVENVSIQVPITYGKIGKKILLIDCGVKNSIIHSLLQRRMQVIRVPWNYDFLSDKKMDYDGIVVSNGPGNPEMCTTTIQNIANAFNEEKPIFGICLGNQLMALAAGAKTYKLKYGHRGQNQPVYIADTKKCFITSQNHGFAVNESTLPRDWKVWMKNANDETNEGIRHSRKPFFAVQFHPEANPGPKDTAFLFDEFFEALK